MPWLEGSGRLAPSPAGPREARPGSWVGGGAGGSRGLQGAGDSSPRTDVRAPAQGLPPPPLCSTGPGTACPGAGAGESGSGRAFTAGVGWGRGLLEPPRTGGSARGRVYSLQPGGLLAAGVVFPGPEGFALVRGCLLRVCPGPERSAWNRGLCSSLEVFTPSPAFCSGSRRSARGQGVLVLGWELCLWPGLLLWSRGASPSRELCSGPGGLLRFWCACPEFVTAGVAGRVAWLVPCTPVVDNRDFNE